MHRILFLFTYAKIEYVSKSMYPPKNRIRTLRILDTINNIFLISNLLIISYISIIERWHKNNNSVTVIYMDESNTTVYNATSAISGWPLSIPNQIPWLFPDFSSMAGDISSTRYFNGSQFFDINYYRPATLYHYFSSNG